MATMVDEKIVHILKKNQLSITESRRRILEIFLRAGSALAHHDVEEKTTLRFDRVTVYRTLQTFMEKGIIHNIPTPDNSILYALCKDDCEEGHHHDNHIHFICSYCGNTTCMDDINIPEIELPSGYSATQINMVVNGICANCNGR
jgi:Fur family ferric uptake transcriptional regulator